MSNVTLFNPAQVPDFIKRRGGVSEIGKALAGGNAGGGGKRISIKGGVFRLISGGKEIAAIEDRFLDVVVVKAAQHINRQFYMAKYDGGAASAPDCWSADGVTPSADSKNRQASKCAECPQNIAGSGQGNSRACRYQQRLAVVLANDMEGDVLQLALPATSIFGKEDGENRPLQVYARWLAAQNIDPADVVTRLKFDTKSQSPKLFFKAMRFLTDDEHESCKKQGETDDATKAVTMTVAKMDSAPEVAAPLEGVRPRSKPAAEDEPPAPAPKKKAAKAEAAPAPAAEEEAEEPVVRKEEKKPSAVPTAKGSLAEMVSDWDDE